MTSSTNRNTVFVFILLQAIHLSLSFPALTESTSLDSNALSDDLDIIKSHFLSRKKRGIVAPATTLPPDIAAHMAMVVPRSYGYIHKPAIVYPIYYYPRYYLRVPRYYPSPKSELFRANDATNYINNLLPIFNRETPNVKEEIPAFPSDPVTGNGGNGVLGGNPTDPLSANFPFWDKQGNSWLWPDGIKTGALPKADVVRIPQSKPKSTLYQLNLKVPQQIQFLHPTPAEDSNTHLQDVILPLSPADANGAQPVDVNQNQPSAVSQP